MPTSKGNDAKKRLKTSKIMVIGLDGATWDLIRPLVAEGKLPTISRLMKNGCFGESQSTLPPTTAPAWSSFTTGKNPSKHGIIGFFAPRADGTLKGWRRADLVNSTFIDAKTIWQILSDKGKKICIINCPMTYPPSKINGIMIAGMLTPISSENFTYPKELKKEIKDYEIDLISAHDAPNRYNVLSALSPGEKLNNEAFLKELYHVMNTRAKHSLALLKKEDWDLFMVVFTATDRIQHLFWKYMNSSNPEYEKNGPWEREINKCYRRLDAIIAELLDNLSKDTTLILLSDHGFGPFQKKHFMINNWLASLNLTTTSSPLISLLQISLRNSRLSWVKKLFPLRTRKKVKALAGPDWKRTIAYGVVTYPPAGGINLNVIGREERGIILPGPEADDTIKKISDALRSLTDEKGNKVIRKVMITKKEFSGLHTNDLPDIIFELAPKYSQRLGTGVGSIFEQFQPGDKEASGTHRMNGILIISGPFIKKGSGIKGARIIDIAPTILYLMGLPIPNDFDGRVLESTIQKPHLKSEPIVFTEAEEFNREQSKYLYDQEEKQQISDRLRALGYM